MLVTRRQTLSLSGACLVAKEQVWWIDYLGSWTANSPSVNQDWGGLARAVEIALMGNQWERHFLGSARVFQLDLRVSAC